MKELKIIKRDLHDKESYELFRLELSQYLNINTKLKEKIIKILDNKKLSSKEMKNLLNHSYLSILIRIYMN